MTKVVNIAQGVKQTVSTGVYPRSDYDLQRPDRLSEEQHIENHRLLSAVSHQMGQVNHWPVETRVVMPDYGAHCDILYHLQCKLRPAKPSKTLAESRHPLSTLVTIEPTLGNLDTIFNRDPKFDCWHYDIFEDSPCVTKDTGIGLRGPYPRRMQESDAGVIAAYISKIYGVEFSDTSVFRNIITKASAVQHNPVLAELGGVQWDGVDRLKELRSRTYQYSDEEMTQYNNLCEIERAKKDEQELMFQQMWRLSMRAAWARVAKPGCKHDVMTLLEGPQGIGKSTLIKVLAGEKYYSDAPIDVNSKDTMQLLQHVWIHEDAEGVATTKTEDKHQKAHLGRTHDQYRQPYGRVTNKVPRHCVFWGTINPDGQGYLRDHTGTRRYWPLPCSKIDLAWFEEHRVQLWAQARHEYETIGVWWLDADQETTRIAINDDRMQPDTQADIIAERVETGVLKYPNYYQKYIKDGVTLSDIMTQILGIDTIRIRQEQAYVGRSLSILKNNGVIARTEKSRRTGTRVTIYYFRDPKDRVQG